MNYQKKMKPWIKKFQILRKRFNGIETKDLMMITSERNYKRNQNREYMKVKMNIRRILLSIKGQLKKLN